MSRIRRRDFLGVLGSALVANNAEAKDEAGTKPFPVTQISNNRETATALSIPTELLTDSGDTDIQKSKIKLILEMYRNKFKSFNNMPKPSSSGYENLVHNLDYSIPSAKPKSRLDVMIIYFQRLDQAYRDRILDEDDMKRIFRLPNQAAVAAFVKLYPEVNPEKLDKFKSEMYRLAGQTDINSTNTFNSLKEAISSL